MDQILDIILDTLIDGAKLLPFLFAAFVIMEFIEHKLSDKSRTAIQKAGKYAPLAGGVLGAFPQCGFSVMATNLYATRIISVGTLIAVYLSTSDEMLPIMISERQNLFLILGTLGLKVLIGILAGFVIDVLLRGKKIGSSDISDFCEDEHCHCEDGILISALKHTAKIILFIVILSFVLNICFHYLGEDIIGRLFLKNSVFGSLVTSVIGLIPNCGASVIITELYLEGAISYGAMLGGLLAGSGVALLVLFKVNKCIKHNLFIVLTVYSIGAISGIVTDIISKLI